MWAIGFTNTEFAALGRIIGTLAVRFVARVFVVLFLITAPLSAMAQSLPRTVLLIDEDTPIHPWFRQLIEAFATTIKIESPNGVYVYVENLGFDTFGSENYYKSATLSFP
jgi:hypothetical protein